MPTYYYGPKGSPGYELSQSSDMIAVRTRSRRSVTSPAGPVPMPESAELADGVLLAEFPDAGVEVYRVPVGRGERSLETRKEALRASPDVRFAGGVLMDKTSKEPVLYTENLFIKFVDSADPDDCVAAIREAGLTIKKQVDYATNAYFVAAPEGTGQEVFEIASKLLKRPDVEYCHPELIRKRAMRSIFPQQWHLKKTTVSGQTIDAHANVEAAHQITQGEGITIAIIDDGVDIDHLEFSSANKVHAPRDVTLKTNNPRPRTGDNHGTACAGVACATGSNGASGVAPKARLIPIRLASGLGSQSEADAFHWAADNGADVISCSWGPADGRWWDLSDPTHQQNVPLPASSKLAIDYAIANGRGGKGCVVLFAAGNGNESVDNDGYASYERVIAVAACNDRGSRSVYSDFGKAVWCAFPSNDMGHPPFSHPNPLTPGIWTTDRMGNQGYNPGNISEGDSAGNFTNNFGGTSSACPGAAGVAALVLAVNPTLNWQEVKALLKKACDKIDPQGGNYNSSGHSAKYGFGRLNARTAVDVAKPQPQNTITISRAFDAPIPDLQTVSFTLDVPEAQAVEGVTVSVDLKHTYIGDLIMTLKPPGSLSMSPIVLHQRAGGSTKNLKKTYDASTTSSLAALVGKSCKGTWTLQIQDAAAQDAGTLVSFGLGLRFAHPESVASTPRRAEKAVRRMKSAAKR
jgi:subtilisin family serine protease